MKKTKKQERLEREEQRRIYKLGYDAYHQEVAIMVVDYLRLLKRIEILSMYYSVKFNDYYHRNRDYDLCFKIISRDYPKTALEFPNPIVKEILIRINSDASKKLLSSKYSCY